MKLISLNTWGCRITEPLFEFIRENISTTDVFCFQEILKGGVGRTDKDELKSGYEDLQGILSGFTGYFSEYGDVGYYYEKNSEGLDFKFGLACFVKNNLKQSFEKSITMCNLKKEYKDYSGRFAAGAALAVNVGDYTVINVHGLWQGSIKTDTEAKLEQSKKIIELAESTKGKKIVCGDFNLLPNIESIKILSDKYQDLIQNYKIEDTRGSLYTKGLRHSDYAFVDDSISVNNFSVPNIGVSDHLPLIINID